MQLKVFFKLLKKQVMVRNELQHFIQYNEEYKNMCGELLDNLILNESTVAAFTRCGTKAGPAFLSHNFTRIFGYPRKHFMEGDLQFLIKYMHSDDLPSFISFAEASTLNASTWKEAKENAVHKCASRIKHQNGGWIWILQKVIVLSVTPDRHIDRVLLLFDDCTAAKQSELHEHVALVEKSRNKSKLLEMLAEASAQTKREKLFDALDEYAFLTSREKQIMQLVSNGFSSKEIAAKLYISRHTVESHRKHILHKLSVRNAPQMVHECVRSAFEQKS
jgi:DNA-binding NarL/FixJ family response regulator